jgi:hypothetical protein
MPNATASNVEKASKPDKTGTTDTTTPNLGSSPTFNVTELPMEPLLISLKDAAPIIGLSYYGFYELVEAGTIPTVYQGRRRYVTPQTLREYVDSLSDSA